MKLLSNSNVATVFSTAIVGTLVGMSLNFATTPLLLPTSSQVSPEWSDKDLFQNKNNAPGHNVRRTQNTAGRREQHGRRLFADVVNDGAFQFARTATDFRHQFAFERMGSSEESGDASPFVYSDEDLKVILRAMHVMMGYMNMGMWSGTTAQHHFIGTASCMVKIHRPADDVALALLHGMYVQEWHHFSGFNKKDECGTRASLATMIGSEMESKLWRTTAIQATGPWSSCVDTQIQLLKIQEEGDRANISNVTRVKLDTCLAAMDSHFYVCDDLEEILGGDVALAGNWKRRDSAHFDSLSELAKTLGEPFLVSMVESARDMSSNLHTENPECPYKEMSPPDRNAVFDSVTYNPDADPMEVDRLKKLTTASRSEQAILNPFLPAFCFKSTCKTIGRSRDLCDSFVKNETNVEEYLDTYFDMLDGLGGCEKKGLSSSKQMAQEVPEWARRSVNT